MNSTKLRLKSFSLITTLLLLTLSVTQVTAVEEHGQPLNEVLDAIVEDQQVTDASKLDCDQLSDNQLEELGEAVMSQMHPDPEIHESMDEMMGGEDSASLRQAHIAMAQRYLGCGSNTGMMMGGMMAGGMMGQDNLESGADSINKSQYYQPNLPQAGMMGHSAGGWGMFSVFGIIAWISLIAFLLAGTYFFIKQASRNSRKK